MKCPHCQSEWKVSSGLSITVQNCPFCGQSLAPQPGEFDSMEGVLCSIRDVYGMDTLKSGKIMLSYFKDLAPKMKKERKMLAEFVDAGGPGVLFTAVTKPESEQRIAVEKVVLCLTEEHLMAENFAQTVCTTYFAVIGGKASAPQPVQASVPAPVPTPAPAPVKPQHDPELFDISPDGTLVRYLGRQLDKVVIPDGVKRIGRGAFKHANLKRIIFPDSLTRIDDEAFSCGVTVVDRLELPDGVTHIGQNAFFGCKFAGIKLPASLRYMGEYAFNCSLLKEITIPGSLKSVPNRAFWFCSELERVTICPGVERLEDYSFYDCDKLKTVKVPASLIDIRPNAFAHIFMHTFTSQDKVQIIFSEPWKDSGPGRFKHVKNIRF